MHPLTGAAGSTCGAMIDELPRTGAAYATLENVHVHEHVARGTSTSQRMTAPQGKLACTTGFVEALRFVHAWPSSLIVLPLGPSSQSLP